MSNGADLPDDIELLKALLVEARSLLAERDVEIEQLKAQIDKLRRMHFGRKSEQLQRQIETLETQLEDLAAGRGVADVQRAQARGANASSSNATMDEAASKQALPAHLPREDHVLEPESNCPDCGQPMRALGEDSSEQLARVAAAFKVIRTIRRKLVCPCCSTITQPPMPWLPIERSIAHPSLLADILVSKYADHQPLYRQSAIAARDGVTLDRASMGRWVGQCEALCAPLTEALRRYTVAATKLHADDTPIPVLSPGNRKTRTGRLWVYVRDDHRSGSTQPASVWFAYSPNRQGIHPQTHLASFKGILQSDAYAGLLQCTPVSLDTRLRPRQSHDIREELVRGSARRSRIIPPAMGFVKRGKVKSGVKVFFADPHSPWQRGTNENTNGLLRQYFPKGTDLSRWSAREIQAVANTLNSRPRKTLAWKTPAEALDEYLKSVQESSVATTG